MKILVLGPGCSNCKKLEKVVHDALTRLNVKADVEKVEDWADIASFGVMSTPGLVIDGTVVCSGRVPTVSQVCEFVTAA